MDENALYYGGLMRRYKRRDDSLRDEFIEEKEVIRERSREIEKSERSDLIHSFNILTTELQPIFYRDSNLSSTNQI